LNQHDPAGYGKMVGADYDGLYPEDLLQTDSTVSFLEELSESLPDRSFLEFGIGTGRLALRMLEAGFEVAGIEGSESMLSQFQEKPGSQEIDARLGDFTECVLERRFSIVALVFNSIFGLLSQEAQIACFRNAAKHLRPGGLFVIEAYVLQPDQMSDQWRVCPRTVSHEQVELQLSRYDAATQDLERVLVLLRESGVRLLTVRDRYAWPGELDMIAQAAGLSLRERHGGWRRENFVSSSQKHVSLYERVEDRGS
jgi:SAM-dependent methyltransferase